MYFLSFFIVSRTTGLFHELLLYCLVGSRPSPSLEIITSLLVVFVEALGAVLLFLLFPNDINQVKALDAAVSNSLDHWDPLQRAYSGLTEKLREQALRHEQMLEVTN